MPTGFPARAGSPSSVADTFKVVEAVMAAQRTLQEGLSIRDKVVSAYQEVARMAI